MKIIGITVAERAPDSFKFNFPATENLTTAPDKRILKNEEEDVEIPVKTDDATMRIKIKTIP